MLEAIVKLLDVLTPLFVALVTAYGAVLVAKLNSLKKDVQTSQAQTAAVHRDLKTNHGSKNIGDAIDILRTKVDEISENQTDLIDTVKKLDRRDVGFDDRLRVVENVVDTALAVTQKAEQAVTDSIQIIAQHKE